MADKRISQLVERVTLLNNDVFPIVASGATTTNKVTLQTIDDYMQTNLDFGVTSVAMTVPTGLSVTGTPITSTGTFVVTFTAGYSIPTNAKQTQWDTAYSNRIVSVTAPITFASNVLGITQSGAASDGYLSSTDWNTFNSKQNALTFGNLTEATSSVLTITGGTGAVIGSGTSIEVKQASSTQDGFLDSADWSTFNGKQNALTGTGIVKSTGGTITYLTDNTSNWDSAYNDKINSAAVTGTTTKTLTLTQQDGGTITTTWTDLVNTGTVTSVGVSMPSAFSVANSPITSSGTIAITGAGTTAQYIDGTGALQTFPSIISQATNLVTEVYNNSGATLSKGTVVYITGGQGNLPTISKALATGDSTSAQTFGVVQNDITNMNNGYVVVAGKLGDLDTQSYPNGTQLYLSSTTAGTWTSTKQYAPDHLVYVGIVVRSHPTQGVVEVKIQNGYEMDEIHDVSAQNPNNNDILQYKTATGLWTKTAGTTTNIAEGTNLYYTDTRSRSSISLTTTGTSGAASYNSTTGVLNIPQYQSVLTNPVTGTGTINTLAKFTATGSTIGNSLFTDNGTNGAFGGTNYSAGTGVRTFNITASQFAGIGFWTGTNQYSADIFAYESTGNLLFNADPTNTLAASNILMDVDGIRIGTFNTTNVTLTRPLVGTSATFNSNTGIIVGANSRAFVRQTTGGDAEFGSPTGGVTYIFSNGTNALQFNSIQSALFTGEIISGSWISAPNARGLTIRNSQNTAYRTALYMNAGNVLILGQDSDITGVTLGVSTANISIASTGNVTFSNDVIARVGNVSSIGYNVYVASASRGSFTTYNLVSGAGTDYSVGMFSEGELFLASGGSATKRFTMSSSGVATFGNVVVFGSTARPASNLGSDLGTSSLRWAEMWGYTLNLNGGTTIPSRLTLARGSDDSSQNALYGWNSIIVQRTTVPISGIQTDFSIIQQGSDGSRTPFYISTSANIGINTTSPSDFIDGESGMAIVQSTNGRAVLSLVGTRADANEALGRLSFTNTNSTNIGSKRLAHISGYRGTTNNSAYLEFATANDGLGVGRMWLSQQGYLGVGISNPQGYIQASVENANNVQMLLVRNFATSATGNFTGSYTAEIRGASSGNLMHSMLIHLNEENSLRRILDVTSTYGTVATFRSDGVVLIRTASGVTGGGALQVNGNVNINGVFQINGVTIGGGGGSGVTGSGSAGFITRWTGTTTLGNGNIYDDGTNIGINTTITPGLLTLRAAVSNTPSLVFQNVVGGPNSAISNYVSAAQTYTVIGTNAYVNNTANIARFNTSLAACYIAFDEGTMVFGTGDTTSVPSSRMNISPSGVVNFLVTTRSPNYGILRAGTFRGGLYTHEAVSGSGTDYGITIFAEGGTNNGNIYFCPNGQATRVMTVNTNSRILMGSATDIGSYTLQVTGTIYATADVIAFSDISVKKNIRNIENALERVTKSRGVLYDRNDIDSNNNIGFIAQELEEQFPELISNNADGTKGVKYHNAVAVLFEAIKEQQKQIEGLKKQIA